MPTVPMSDKTRRMTGYSPYGYGRTQKMPWDWTGITGEEEAAPNLPPPVIMGAPATPEARATIGTADQPTTATPAPDVQQPGFFNRLFTSLGRPEAQAFLLSMGSNLLRPPQFGETTAQQIGQSLIRGYGGLSALNNRRLAQEEQRRKAGLEERKVKVTEDQLKQTGEQQAADRTQKRETEAGRQAIDWARLTNEKDKTQIDREKADLAWTAQDRQLKVSEGQLKVAQDKLKILEKQGVRDTRLDAIRAETARLQAATAVDRVQLDILGLAQKGELTDPALVGMTSRMMGQAVSAIAAGYQTDEQKAAAYEGLRKNIPAFYQSLKGAPTAPPTTPQAPAPSVPTTGIGPKLKSLADRYGVKLPGSK